MQAQSKEMVNPEEGRLPTQDDNGLPQAEAPTSSIQVDVRSSANVSSIRDVESSIPTRHVSTVRYRGRNFIGCCEVRKGLIIMTSIDSIIGFLTLLFYIAVATSFFNSHHQDSAFTVVSLIRSFCHLVTLSVLLFAIIRRHKRICIVCQGLEWIWTITGVIVIACIAGPTVNLTFQILVSVCVILYEVGSTVLICFFIREINMARAIREYEEENES